MAKGLMISRKDLVKYTSLSGNIDTDKFIQYVLIAQEITVQQLLGTDLYEKIQGDIESSSLTGDYLTLVNDYIKPVLIHAAAVQYIPFASYTFGNKGVFKHTSETGETVSKEEVDYLVEEERDTMQFYADRLIDHLSFNAPSKYPEYNTNTNEDISPITGQSYTGWVL